jgi:nitrogen fixation protein
MSLNEQGVGGHIVNRNGWEALLRERIKKEKINLQKNE